MVIVSQRVMGNSGKYTNHRWFPNPHKHAQLIDIRRNLGYLNRHPLSVLKGNVHLDNSVGFLGNIVWAERGFM